MANTFTIVGLGRAGSSLHQGLIALGWVCSQVYRRGDDVTDAAKDADVCIIATPDGAIAETATRIAPGNAVVVHLSGALGLDVCAPHRAGGLHPLVSLANEASGATQLGSCYYAVAGNEITTELAEALSGKYFVVADGDRARYHAAAAIASNHLVALLGQVERLADGLGIPFEVFAPLVSSSLDNVKDLGPQGALTGPAARGDLDTIRRHRDALIEHHPDELAAYDCLVDLAQRLARDPDGDGRSEGEGQTP